MSEFETSLRHIEDRKNFYLQRWSVAGGKYNPPDPERFGFLAESLNRGNTYLLSLAATLYALEVCGRIPSAEVCSKPLERLTPDMPYSKRVFQVDKFLAMDAFKEEVKGQLESAAEYCAESSESQLRQIRDMIGQITPEFDFTHVPVLRVLSSMHNSQEAGFKLVKEPVYRLSRSTVLVMFARQNAIELPEPDWAYNNE